MSQTWEAHLIDRLIDAARPDGAWGYQNSAVGASEPTALAALALAAHDKAKNLRHAGLTWLARQQTSRGAVPVISDVPTSAWPTPLAIIAWLRAANDGGPFDREVALACQWLLRTHGETMECDPRLFEHDCTLVGWSWVPGAYCWVEPTAYAVLALRAAGLGDHARVAEARRLLWDRVLPSGGWNYGNTRVIDHMLNPFPATTGIALAALSDMDADEQVAPSIAYLRSELPRIRTPMSLGWGLIGLGAWGRRPPGSPQWLASAGAAEAQRPANVVDLACLLLASAPACPLVSEKVSTG